MWGSLGSLLKASAVKDETRQGVGNIGWRDKKEIQKGVLQLAHDPNLKTANRFRGDEIELIFL